MHCHPDSGRLPGETLTAKVESLLRIADRMGIERLGLFLRVGESNQREVEQLLTHRSDRVFGFLWILLWNTTVAENIARLDRWIADGPMVGVKLGGDSGVCSVPVYDPVFAHAAKLRAIVYQHTWLKVGGDPPVIGGATLPTESKPQDVAILAARRPEAPIICGHTGGDWELGVRAVRAHQNVSVEIGGGWPARGQVEFAVKELGADRVIYGSDVIGRGFASQLGKVYGADISDADRELIFSGNIRRLAAPIFRAKGMEA
jgi:predicted TIM-barrel fold metal-dependent hydrolase